MCEIPTKEWTENMCFVVLGIVVEKYSGEVRSIIMVLNKVSYFESFEVVLLFLNGGYFILSRVLTSY